MCVREKIQKDFNFTKEGEVSIYRNSGKDKAVPVEVYTTKIKHNVVDGLNNFKDLYEKYYAKIYADIIYEIILKDSKDTIDIYFFTAPEKEKELEVNNNLNFLQYKYRYKIDRILSELTTKLNANVTSINDYIYQYKTDKGITTNLIFRLNDEHFYIQTNNFEEISPSILIIDPEYYYNSSLKNVERTVIKFISNMVLIDEKFFYKYKTVKYFKNYIISEYKPQFLTNNFNGIHDIYKYNMLNKNNENIQTKEIEHFTDNINVQTFDSCLIELYKEYLSIEKSKETTMRRNQVLDIILKTTQIRDNLKKEESNNKTNYLDLIRNNVDEGLFKIEVDVIINARNCTVPALLLPINSCDLGYECSIEDAILTNTNIKSIMSNNSKLFICGYVKIYHNNDIKIYGKIGVMVAYKTINNKVKFSMVYKGCKVEDISPNESHFIPIKENILDECNYDYKGIYLQYFEKALEGGEFDE